MKAKTDLSHLIALSARYGVKSSPDVQSLPRLSIFRRVAASEIEAFVYEPIICLILQGRKTTCIGDQSVELKPGDALLVSHDLPVESRITHASEKEPYLALILSLDLGLVRGLYELVSDAGFPEAETHPLSAAPADPMWLEPLARYFELLDDLLDAQVLGPSILREIHYRLLLSPIGQMLRQLLIADSHASRIARALKTLRSDFHSTLSVPDLAKTAGMSTSSFHQHFKQVTGTTPIQYQKDLRLIAARTSLVEQGNSVSEAAYLVGYESPTHFSRDYSRKYGVSPSKDATAFSVSSHVGGSHMA